MNFKKIIVTIDF